MEGLGCTVDVQRELRAASLWIAFDIRHIPFYHLPLLNFIKNKNGLGC